VASSDTSSLPNVTPADADLIYVIQGGNSRNATVDDARTLSGDAQHGARGGGTQHADVVAAGAAGFMTGADKTKLDGITAGAQPNTVDSVFGRFGAVVAASSDYDDVQVDNTSVVPGATVKDALDELATSPQQASATGDTTTTSATDVLMGPMSITPGAGDYLVWFSSSFEHSAVNSSIWISLYVGGVQVAHTEREFRRGGAAADAAMGLSFQSHETGLGGADAIEVRWRTNNATATAHERTLTIQKVL
jgi:hypothetical protein